MNRKEVVLAVTSGCVGAVLTMAVCSFSPLGAQSQSDVNFGKITCTGLEVVNADGKVVAHMIAGRDGGDISVRGKNGGSVYMWADEHGGRADLYGKGSTSVKITEDGGCVEVRTSTRRVGSTMLGAIMRAVGHAGEVTVQDTVDGIENYVTMGLDGVNIFRSNLGKASMKITKDGGQVSIDSWNEDKQNVKKAIMEVSESSSRVFVQHDELHNRRATMIVTQVGSLVNLEGMALMGVHDHGASVEVLGKDDKVKASMSVNEYGRGVVSTWDKNGYRLE